jgi:predicted SAM-dependent methyltransferase
MNDPVYDNYWQRKQLLQNQAPSFPVARWWATPDLCDIERIYFDRIRSAKTLLDVGAGDLRVKQKFEKAGYTGVYHTQDIGGEYQHTYRNLDEVATTYDAILCFDVIEHLTLSTGLGLVQRMVQLLAPGGHLILQTPNAKCIRSPYSWDMTHLHTYNLPDLWAYLTAMNMSVDGYRVWFNGPSNSLKMRVHKSIAKFITTRWLGADYADNIALVATRRG